ncbi:MULTISPECIES: pirin family protein [unclassified Microcoleus]|uniref:pirin family protein n=1 Tax=unclassified Microcoleus TaxID=2642155 RepID=UPI002FD33FAE
MGGFQARHLLPSDVLALVGPFIFFDHLGPAVFPPGRGVDVRPHPHINLATVTYLFEGVLLHRDSVGSVQEIRQACGELDDGRARHCPLRTHA